MPAVKSLRFWGAACVGLVALAMANPVLAAFEDRRVSDQVFLPNSLPAGESEFRKGDYVAKFPTRWTVAAKLDAPITLTQGQEKPRELAAGALLPATQVDVDREGTSKFDGYCTERNAEERKYESGVRKLFVGALTYKAVRAATDQQYCLIDTNNDGLFDEWRFVGGDWKDRAVSHAITPLAYHRVELEPVSANDWVNLKLEGVGKDWAEFRIELIQQGLRRKFENLSSGGVGYTRKNKISLKGPLPVRTSIYGIEFEIVAFDPKVRTVRLRWPSDRDPARRMVVPQDRDW